MLCKLFEIFSSGYLASLKPSDLPRKNRGEKLTKEIKTAFSQHKNR